MDARLTPLHRPTAEDLRRAVRRRLRDVVAPGLDVLFVGINPGLYSAAVGHHFARPGNRFWKALFASGFTDRLVSPFDDAALLASGLGITNLCPRTTAQAEELTSAELRAGARALERKLRRHRPQVVAFLGIGAYRTAFSRPKALIGPQAAELVGVRVWVLPNPSGRTAHYQLDALVARFRELRTAVGRPTARGGGPSP